MTTVFFSMQQVCIDQLTDMMGNSRLSQIKHLRDGLALQPILLLLNSLHDLDTVRITQRLGDLFQLFIIKVRIHICKSIDLFWIYHSAVVIGFSERKGSILINLMSRHQLPVWLHQRQGSVRLKRVICLNPGRQWLAPLPPAGRCASWENPWTYQT